jgi:hypothetical protein
MNINEMFLMDFIPLETFSYNGIRIYRMVEFTELIRIDIILKGYDLKDGRNE